MRKYQLIIISAILILSLVIPGGSCYADGETPEGVYKKAPYLDFVNAYTTVMYTPCEKFTENVREDCPERVSGEEIRTLIFGNGLTGKEHLFGAEFLVSEAARCDLIDAGTFIRTSSCEEQYTFLTETNLFPHYHLKSCTALGGSEYEAAVGDVIFWFEGAGNAVNLGIVTSVSPEMTVCVYNSQTGPAHFAVVKGGDEIFSGQAEIVSIEFPVYEHLTFMFCYEEMDYPPSAICGIMANIYAESEFLPYARESSGYGFGICQWSRAHRGDLESWCTENGYDYNTLYGQLEYLKHDLADNDPDLDEALRKKGWTMMDTYSAGYTFCQRYERPLEEQCNDRGNIAARSFYGGYGGYPYQ